MNTDRVLREIDRRLAALDEKHRGEVLDAVREEIARDRRRVDPSLTVEAERERRLEAETLREVLEAISRQARLEETLGEVLKQLSRIVSFDSCSVALLDPEGRFRIVAVRGFPEPSKMVGVAFRDLVTDVIRQNRWPVTLPDVREDERFAKLEGAERIRSWAGLPLLVEGEVIGLLALDRHRVEPFDEESLHQAKAVAFSAAAAIRKAQLLEQVRRYANLMEQVVTVDHAVFDGKAPADVARTVLTGALRVGTHHAGMLVLDAPGGPRVAVAEGDAFAGSEGRPVPTELMARAVTRMPPEAHVPVCRALGVPPPRDPLFLVPLASEDAYLGTLVLLDSDGESPDDRMMEAYASRAAEAYLHALHSQGR
jgi:hypothetical protein